MNNYYMDYSSGLFTRHGIQVTSCSHASQAIEELNKKSYDLVVTDFMMPEMDGFELLSHIRNEHLQTKVIMITAHSNVQHAVRSMKGGAIDYIPKPFSTTELVERGSEMPCYSRSGAQQIELRRGEREADRKINLKESNM